MPLSATKAAEKLPHSAVAAVVPTELIRLTCVVIRSWVDAWKDDPECRNFLRRRRFFEVCVVAQDYMCMMDAF